MGRALHAAQGLTSWCRSHPAQAVFPHGTLRGWWSWKGPGCLWTVRTGEDRPGGLKTAPGSWVSQVPQEPLRGPGTRAPPGAVGAQGSRVPEQGPGRSTMCACAGIVTAVPRGEATHPDHPDGQGGWAGLPQSL